MTEAITVEGISKISSPISNGENTLRDPKGHFIAGCKGISTGRPAGSRDLWNELYDALRKSERKHKRSFASRLIELGWTETESAWKVAEKFYSDLPRDPERTSGITINILYGSNPRLMRVAQAREELLTHATA